MASPSTSAADAVNGLASFPAGLRVLVVDDDLLCLKVVEKMLKTCGYKGTNATDERALGESHARERTGTIGYPRRTHDDGTRCARSNACTRWKPFLNKPLSRIERGFTVDARVTGARARETQCPYPSMGRALRSSERATGVETSEQSARDGLTIISYACSSHSHRVFEFANSVEDFAREEGRFRHRPERCAHAGHGWV